MADDETEVAPDDIVKSVAAEMRGLPRAEPTAAELVARQEWLAECRRREAERRAAYLDAQADAQAQQRAAEEHQALLERQAVQRRHSAEMMERSRQRSHERSVFEKLTAAETFRREMVVAARNAAAQQNRQAMLDDLQRDIDALVPKPAPTTVIVQEIEPDDDRPWYSPDPNKSWW